MLNNALHSGDDTGTFSHINLSSNYHDINSFIQTYSNSNVPIFLSINAQSLQSKFNPLLEIISHLSNSTVRIDIIAIQETWSVPYLDLFAIPGYHPPIFESRTGSRGGGVGFYINLNIKFKHINPVPLSAPRTFECICIEIQHNNKPIIISNLYRSPNSPSGTSVSDHTDNFINMLDTHLTFLNSSNKNSFILTDANINLATLNLNPLCSNYFNTILSNGFIPLNTKSTRIQGDSHSLIDHIITNSNSPENIRTGTIISDISDHFINFVSLTTPPTSKKHKTKSFRDMNPTNINNFRTHLSNMTWHDVYNSRDVNTSLELFWSDFKTIFDLCFPIKIIRFNKNTHKINNFMTSGLLVSRNTKLRLHKISIDNPSNTNITAYRKYRNIYNSVLRNSKKLYFESNP